MLNLKGYLNCIIALVQKLQRLCRMVQRINKDNPKKCKYYTLVITIFCVLKIQHIRDL